MPDSHDPIPAARWLRQDAHNIKERKDSGNKISCKHQSEKRQEARILKTEKQNQPGPLNPHKKPKAVATPAAGPVYPDVKNEVGRKVKLCNVHKGHKPMIRATQYEL
jgi:hypothetical protein